MDKIQAFTNEQLKTDVPSFEIGDSVVVHNKIKEGSRERIQLFDGMVIAKKNGGISETFTVRKISSGIGVERIFPFASPFIDSIELNKIGKVRRARIFYLRELSGKKARIKEKKLAILKEENA